MFARRLLFFGFVAGGFCARNAATPPTLSSSARSVGFLVPAGPLRAPLRSLPPAHTAGRALALPTALQAAASRKHPQKSMWTGMKWDSANKRWLHESHDPTAGLRGLSSDAAAETEEGEEVAAGPVASEAPRARPKNMWTGMKWDGARKQWIHPPAEGDSGDGDEGQEGKEESVVIEFAMRAGAAKVPLSRIRKKKRTTAPAAEAWPTLTTGFSDVVAKGRALLMKNEFNHIVPKPSEDQKEADDGEQAEAFEFAAPQIEAAQVLVVAAGVAASALYQIAKCRGSASFGPAGAVAQASLLAAAAAKSLASCTRTLEPLVAF